MSTETRKVISTSTKTKGTNSKGYRTKTQMVVYKEVVGKRKNGSPKHISTTKHEAVS